MRKSRLLEDMRGEKYQPCGSKYQTYVSKDQKWINFRGEVPNWYSFGVRSTNLVLADRLLGQAEELIVKEGLRK